MSGETLNLGRIVGEKLDTLVADREAAVNESLAEFNANRNLAQKFKIHRKLREIATALKERGFSATVTASKRPTVSNPDGRHPATSGLSDYRIELGWRQLDREKQVLRVIAENTGRTLRIGGNGVDPQTLESDDLNPSKVDETLIRSFLGSR